MTRNELKIAVKNIELLRLEELLHKQSLLHSPGNGRQFFCPREQQNYDHPIGDVSMRKDWPATNHGRGFFLFNSVHAGVKILLT